MTASDALDELRKALDRRGVVFAMARVKHELYDQLASAGFIQRLGPERIFPTLPTAVAAYTRWRTERRADPPPPTALDE